MKKEKEYSLKERMAWVEGWDARNVDIDLAMREVMYKAETEELPIKEWDVKAVLESLKKELEEK